MRIAIDYIQGAYLRDYEKTYVDFFGGEVEKQGTEAGISLVADPARADLIILWEGFEYKTPPYIPILEADPLIRRYADRVYTINYDDHPEGFLAGVYTSLEAPFFENSIHRIWPFFKMNNERIYDLTREEVMAYNPSLLFSFRGAASHSVRKRLFEIYAKESSKYVVEHVKRWYDHADDDRLKFARLALSSVFCLCPHGYCSYTPRITEVMAMARVPVIIADDWIPFSFPENVPYYIKVPESDIERLPQILESRRDEADAMRRNARMLWERYLSPQTRAFGVAQAVVRLAQESNQKRTFDWYRERWHSRRFQRNLGWTFPQMTALRLEQHVRRYFPSAKVPGVSKLMRYRNAPNLK